MPFLRFSQSFEEKNIRRKDHVHDKYTIVKSSTRVITYKMIIISVEKAQFGVCLAVHQQTEISEENGSNHPNSTLRKEGGGERTMIPHSLQTDRRSDKLARR